MRAPVTLRPGGRVRTQWMALAAALVVLAGVVVTWAVSSAGRRVQVVQVAQRVDAGTPIEAADLITAAVAFDQGVDGLVPAESLDALLGRIAAIDLEPGVLLQRGMWRDGESLEVGERAVGAVLGAGRYPPGLASGDVVIGAPLSGLFVTDSGGPSGQAGDTADGATGAPVLGPSAGPSNAMVVDDATGVAMRVLEVALLESGAVGVSLAVGAEQAIAIAQLAASDQLVVVRLPVNGDAAREGAP